MKKQFEILKELSAFLIDANKKLKKLQDTIESEHKKVRDKLINAYNHSDEILYLIEFDSDKVLVIHKATKKRVWRFYFSWYGSKISLNKPSNEKDAETLINHISNPTSINIWDHEEFGYFDDEKRRYDRIDWIAEKIVNKEYLYEITKKDYQSITSRLINQFILQNNENEQISGYTK